MRILLLGLLFLSGFIQNSFADIVKAGHHVGFDRIVVNTPVAFTVTRFEDYAVLKLHKNIKTDLNKIIPILAPSLRKISLRTTPKTTEFIISDYPKSRPIISQKIKHGVYFDLYWPELKGKCDSVKCQKKVKKEMTAPKTALHTSVWEIFPVRCSNGQPCFKLTMSYRSEQLSLFEKDGGLWIVFPEKTDLTIENRNQSSLAFQQLDIPDGTAVRIEMPDGYKGTLTDDKTIRITPENTKENEKMLIPSLPLLSDGIIAFPEQEQIKEIRFYDPVVGNEIVTFPTASSFNPERYRLSFVEVLPSLSGLTFVSWTEALAFQNINHYLRPIAP